jgi:hypothetical protein
MESWHLSDLKKRWALSRLDESRKFPTKEDRCIKVLENFDTPSHDPRRPSIKVWRDGLSDSERGSLNHPKRVWTAYWAKTEPRVERDAKLRERERKQAMKSADPMLDKVGEAEAETHAARRQVEAMRELLVLIRDHVNLPEEKPYAPNGSARVPAARSPNMTASCATATARSGNGGGRQGEPSLPPSERLGSVIIRARNGPNICVG